MLLQLLLHWVMIFVPMLVVLDPAGSIPVYLAITDRYTQAQRRLIARRATLAAAVTGVVFIIGGQAILKLLGVSFADFQIAGGIMLVVLCLVDLLLPGKPAVDEKKAVELDGTIGIVPLAVPLIVGPATMTTSLLLVNTYTPIYEKLYGEPLGSVIAVALVVTALLATLAIQMGAMWHSDVLVRLLGRNTMAVVNKIVMILLAAIAVSLIRQGVVSIVSGLRGT
jgi:multiple antibiotic resistance protein